MIPYGKQEITESDISAVVEVLRSDFLTQGPNVPRFEREVASYCGASHAVAASSATAALHLACLTLGVGEGDIVWTSPITFVASANCAVYCGADVDFVDIDPNTFNMCPAALEIKLAEAKLQNRLPKVLIPVHMCGQSCEMDRIHAAAKKYDLRIIEDASHAIGGSYKGRPIGSCAFSDITIFSFHPVKIITTGEGGMALTNSEKMAAKMERLRSHGITRDPGEMQGSPDGPWYYQQLDLGYNYRMTELQAALGISQLRRLDQFVKSRNELAGIYHDLVAESGVGTPQLNTPEAYSAYHLFVVRLDLNTLKTTQKEIFERLRSRGILVNLHYIPVYKHPFYRQRGHANTFLPSAEVYYRAAITLPLYPSITLEQQKLIVNSISSPLGFQTIF